MSVAVGTLMPMTDNLYALHFTRYDMTEQGSASPLFAGKSAKVTGIYVLEFASGQRYVGQTRNIVTRYATHRRHHGDIVALNFAPCLVAELDAAERAVIHEQEQHHSLRNLMLTDRPGGAGDLEVTREEEVTATLPWQRDRRLTARDEANSHRQRAWQLAARTDWPEISKALATYVHETIPAPIGTAGQLWTLSALPATSKRPGDRRLITLSCGRLDACYALNVRQMRRGVSMFRKSHNQPLTEMVLGEIGV